MEEVTRIEDHLNETMLKIFDDHHFDDSVTMMTNIDREKLELRKKNKEMNSEKMFNLGSQSTYSSNQHASRVSVTNRKFEPYCTTPKLVSTSFNDSILRPSKPFINQFQESRKATSQFLSSQEKRFGSSNMCSYRYNSNSSIMPTFYSSKQSLEQKSYDAHSFYQINSSVSGVPQSSNYRIDTNSNYQFQYFQPSVRMQAGIPPYNSQKQMGYNFTNSMKALEKGDTNLKCQSNDQIIKNKRVTAYSDHKATKNNYDQLSLEEIISVIPAICIEQYGCRFLQSKIDQIPKFAENIVLPKIHLQLEELINHRFGNYLIQKLIDKLPPYSLSTIKAVVSCSK